MNRSSLFVSAFQERQPDYPGGIWMVRGNRAHEIYSGLGTFGLSWLGGEKLLLAATRVQSTPLLAFRFSESGATPVPIRYENFIPPFRTHGMDLHGDTLFLVATQGDPDAEMSVNTDRWANHRVGKVIISRLSATAHEVVVSNSSVWNPFECNHHHHINDILADERFLYLVSFSTCRPDGTYIDKGSITRFRRDLQFDRTLTEELDAPHSLQMFDGRLYVCSSGTSSVHSLSTDGGDLRLEYKGLNNFVRGVWVNDVWLSVGLSRSAGRTGGDRLTDSLNGVLRFNRRDGTTLRIPLPDFCDNTYSLVGVDAHGWTLPARRKFSSLLRLGLHQSRRVLRRLLRMGR